MIVFNLICKDCNYEFEGWFDNSRVFEMQNKKKLINCPSCEGFVIKKTLMAPNIYKKSNSKDVAKKKKAMVNSVKKYKKIIEKNFDYVGDNFTEEAKKMKYGEVNERPIYGEADLEQTKELMDEEINIVPLPWTNSKKTN
jgi:hypothetical protein|tara:strand:- start:167 stop:586 length:420 start_codon:yes stop_codon:yes gene_type:complete